MSLAETTYQVEYPEIDGKPVAETDIYLHWMFRIRDILKHRYREQRFYVGANLLIYFVEGNPKKVVAPDVFVVNDCDPGFRRTFKVWEERRVPNVAIEVTSKGTRREDEVFKPKDFAEIGIEEYYLYDPTADYLHPPLNGYRWVRDGYEPIEANARGLAECRSLSVTLELDGRDLVLRDMATGAVLLTSAEAADLLRDIAEKKREIAEARHVAAEAGRAAAEADRDAEQAARQVAEAERDAEQAARQAVEARAAALEEELLRLRELRDGESRPTE
jgi:Uma2 family endonuclease